MKRINGFQYEVVEDERIDVNIKPHKITPMVTAQLDGQPILPINQTTISFDINKSGNEMHLLDLSFGFPPGSPSDASYQVVVNGSVGNEKHSFDVELENPHRHLVLVFQVRFGDTGPK